ncbi:MAG: TatD family hydrolase [Chloroflexi bacterium]|nr:TatD family hydrolase [Chloroflexota bacterium]
MSAPAATLPAIDGPLVDAHAHSWSPELEPDHAGVLARAWGAGLAAIVEVGVDLETSARSLALARKEPRVRAAGGLHPHEASRLESQREGLAALLARGAASGELSAVGELGLDFYRNLSPRPDQERALRWQLGLARELELPVVVHARAADEECYGELRAWAQRAGRYLGPGREIGMMHCFAGDAELGRRYVELGFLLSIPGTVTYRNNERGRRVARETPLAAMLVETDCPYLTPVPHRGRRNEPAYVAYTVREIAALRGESERAVARATAENAARLFGFALGG